MDSLVTVEPAVPFGDVEIGADVAVDVPAGGTVGRFGVDVQFVGQTALAVGVARGEEPRP